jgi:hypothetical protein
VAEISDLRPSWTVAQIRTVAQIGDPRHRPPICATVQDGGADHAESRRSGTVAQIFDLRNLRRRNPKVCTHEVMPNH